MLQIKYLTQRAYEGDFKKIWKSWNTCAEEIKGEEPRWVVDIDNNPKDNLCEVAWDLIADFIDLECEPHNTVLHNPFRVAKVITNIPTKNGIHLITTPFNLQQFKEKYPDIDVHKNNPTLLYCP